MATRPLYAGRIPSRPIRVGPQSRFIGGLVTTAEPTVLVMPEILRARWIPEQPIRVGPSSRFIGGLATTTAATGVVTRYPYVGGGYFPN